MGGGSYGYDARRLMNSVQYSADVSREEVFRQNRMSQEMNIRGKRRECRNSEEHPDAFPIIIALDVTGSMGHIPDKLIRTGLPDIMEKILESGVKDPQVCFMAIGDQYCDSAPIQVGQFESSDELMDKWLKTVWLEGRGGGNGGESYQLAWYAALFHTDCDWIKSGKRGVLITIGDDAVHKSLSLDEIKRLFGNTSVETDLSTSRLYDMVSSRWDVYHINICDYQGTRPTVKLSWDNLLGNHLVNTEDAEGNDIPGIISGIILNMYKNQNGISNENRTGTAEQKQSMNFENTEHLL